MKILSMSATFGKLDGATLELKPDFNVISAPNEWGKSTWCSFMVAMLYGIETSQRTSSKGLADKERFAPWNGKPMSGRMDIEWKGRKITIERSNKGRTPFGNFKAYETETGMEVTELTGDNCGLMLLGVEKNVYTRAGFVRQTEMPVTDDLALRRRLNELVTTGDETGASDTLAKKLKDLKNSCRHNKTGLLPQAESQRDLIADKLAQIQYSKQQMAAIAQRQAAILTEVDALENHKAVLTYQASKKNLERVETAKVARDAAQLKVRSLETQCMDLPAAEFAQKKLQQVEEIQNRWAAFQTKAQPLPPEIPAMFAGMDSAQAVRQATQDKAAYDELSKPASLLFLIIAIFGLVAGIGLLFIHPLLIIGGLALAIAFGGLYIADGNKKKKGREDLARRYGDLPSDSWVSLATRYGDAQQNYDDAARLLKKERAELQEETEALTGNRSLQEVAETYRQAIALWKTLEGAKAEALRSAQHAEALAEMVEEVAAPEKEDHLTWSLQETQRLLAELAAEQKALERKQGQFMGQMETLGSQEDLQKQLQQVQDRIAKLEDTYTALTIAQETLTEAANELQRRFPPKIAQKAQELFGRMTGGRYDRLILGQDLSVSAAAAGEDTLHAAPWRSDGTVDQLYLAVRLAVAQALTPEAPVVLDDALVRFDETRLKKTMTLLKEESDQKQIIIFSCQDRECNYA